LPGAFHHWQNCAGLVGEGVARDCVVEINRPFLDRFFIATARHQLSCRPECNRDFRGSATGMADEILWRAKNRAVKAARKLSAGERNELFLATKFVASRIAAHHRPG